MDFLGVAREPLFSPGKVDADAAILHAVAGELAAHGASVRVVDAGALPHLRPDPATLVFAMCQGDAALACLTGWGKRGVRVINTPQAILASQRCRAIPLLEATGVAQPRTVVVDADADALPAPGSFVATPLWAKRGDVHATHPEDVVFVDRAVDLAPVLAAFRRRGIGRVALQRHVAGTVFKFYATAGGFFHGVVPADAEAPSADALAAMAALGASGAAALGLEVYGGDCVVDATGAVHLIDLNDWPSYGPCRAQGATAIAAYIRAQKDGACS